jgi:hypothetical protein
MFKPHDNEIPPEGIEQALQRWLGLFVAQIAARQKCARLPVGARPNENGLSLLQRKKWASASRYYVSSHIEAATLLKRSQLKMNVAAYSTMVKSEQTSTLETDIHSDKRRFLVAIGWVTAVEAIEKFVHEQNVARYRQHLADETDEVTRKMLLHLLAEEERKTG